MMLKDADIGDKVFLINQHLAIRKTHRIKGVTIDHPNSQMDAGIEHTVGQYVECEKIEHYQPRIF